LRRPGAAARYLGPCVARDSATASLLIRAAIAEYPGEPRFWDLLPENRPAGALASELGFTRVRRLVRMRLGPPLSGNDAFVYSIAGFEFG